MKFRDYVKDHIFILVMEVIALVISNIFMDAFGVHMGLTVAVTVTFLLAFIVSFFWDYARKRKYYSAMEENMQALDKKYLIAETLEEPDFYEGKLVNDMIREMEKSMYEHVAGAKKYAGDFKEYIEMWVHEVKLPIAGLMLRVNNLRDQLESQLSDEEAEMTAGEADNVEDSERMRAEAGEVNSDAVSGNAQNADENEKSVKARLQELTEVEAQLKRINDYTEQVLYYARSENTEKDYVIRETRLGSAVSSTNIQTFLNNEEPKILLIHSGKTDRY